MTKEEIELELENLERKYEFTPFIGWDQVVGKGEKINRAYGRWALLMEL